MENKDFDKKLESALIERRINPSENAWERLMLQRQAKKPKRRLPILWIAAHLIIALGIFSLLNIGSDVPENKVVSVPSEKTIITEPIAVDTLKIRTPEMKKDREKPAPKALYAAGPKEDIKKIIEPVNAQQANLEQRKIEEIASVIIQMNESGKEILEDDVDALIEKARREIAAGNGLSKQTDASALLNESEKELTNEFRSNVFQNLIKHKRIRIAFGGSR